MAAVARRYSKLWPYLNIAGILVLAAYWALLPVDGFDLESFYGLDLANLYTGAWHEEDSFVYSPAFAQLIYPLTLLPFVVFAKVWLALNLLCLVWLLGPAGAAFSLALLPVTSELRTGQIHLMVAVALVIGMRYGAAWCFILLTKVTPGVGLVWFAVRREWRPLAVAASVTTAVFAVSYLTLPNAWTDWFALIAGSASRPTPQYTVVQSPVSVRLPIAAVLVAAAAWRNRPAALPIILWFALPAVWFSALTLLAAVPKMMLERWTGDAK